METVSTLFDLSRTSHAELFDDAKYGWEMLPMIAEYVEYALEDARIDSDTSKAAYIGKGVSIGANTVIEAGVVILGPALIGNNCHIRAGAYIREHAIIGDSCVVGHASEIKNSILFNEARVPHFNYVGDSVLGYKAHLGAGVIISNMKSSGGTIQIVTLHETIDTGLTKFGALIGDGAEIGVHAVLNPGSIIGKHSMVYPLVSVRGIIPPNSIVKLRQNQDIVMKSQQ